MKVAALAWSGFEAEGLDALETSMPFDEFATLNLNKDLLAAALGLKEIKVSNERPVKSNVDIIPGKPSIVLEE